MLNLPDIIATYPTHLHTRQEHILREYLQYHILEGIFTSSFASKVCFIGGTALRLCYHNDRFSEDIDLDNFGLSYEDFTAMMAEVNTSLIIKGFETDRKNVQKGAYHCHLKFPRLLYENGLAPMSNTRILIQIDTVEQGYAFTPDKFLCETFETLAVWNVVSPSLLLSHKLFACFERKKLKGRDFFDILFIIKKHTKKPDYAYLGQKLGIYTPDQLSTYILAKCEGVNFVELQQDVSPFLFDPKSQAVTMFPEIIRQISWDN